VDDRTEKVIVQNLRKERNKTIDRLQIKYNSRRDFWCKEGGAKQSSPEAAAGKHLITTPHLVLSATAVFIRATLFDTETQHESVF
jgi:hypothetical protein